MTGGGAVFTWLATIWAGLAVPALAACLSRWDPLERAGGRGVGPRVNSRWGWFLMEIPALATFPGIYLASSHHHPVGTLVVIMWVTHLRPPRLPVAVAGAAARPHPAADNQRLRHPLQHRQWRLWGWFMGHVAHYPPNWLGRPLVVAGLVLAIGGAALNVWCDHRLSRMRKASGGAYVMPSGGPFDLVSCPNLLGEIVEWVGFALLTWSLPGLAFAMWTIANLVPRALGTQVERFPVLHYPISTLMANIPWIDSSSWSLQRIRRNSRGPTGSPFKVNSASASTPPVQRK